MGLRRSRQSPDQPIIFWAIQPQLGNTLRAPCSHTCIQFNLTVFNTHISHSQSALTHPIGITSHRGTMKHQLLFVKSILMKKQCLLYNRQRLNPAGELIKQLMRKNQPKRCLEGRSHPKLTSVSVIGFDR